MIMTAPMLTGTIAPIPSIQAPAAAAMMQGNKKTNAA